MSKDKSTDISVKQARSFLRDHPTFLDENPDILETMIVPHKPEGAISLIERQLAALRDRNKEMHGQLDGLYSLTSIGARIKGVTVIQRMTLCNFLNFHSPV